jgi:hypothetical protein
MDDDFADLFFLRKKCISPLPLPPALKGELFDRSNLIDSVNDVMISTKKHLHKI